jgi:penicillin-binding protein-related factor A (putative recombinase)
VNPQSRETNKKSSRNSQEKANSIPLSQIHGKANNVKLKYYMILDYIYITSIPPKMTHNAVYVAKV